MTASTNDSATTNIADESVPAAGGTKETAATSSDNSSSNKKSTSNGAKKATAPEQTETNVDEKADGDIIETEINDDKADENTNTIADTEVPTTGEDNTAIDSKDSSNGFLPIAVGLAAVAAAAVIGFQVYNVRKRK